MARNASLRKMYKIFMNITTYIPVTGNFLIITTRSIQLRNTAIAPNSHCHVVGQKQSVKNMNANTIENTNRMISI